MLLHLIKKDILLAKAIVIWAMLFIIAIPLFFKTVIPFPADLLSFLYMVVFAEIILLQNISAYEAKSPKASALLCAAPYTRRAVVQAKYVFFALLFALCYIIHTFFSLLIDSSHILNLTSVLVVLLCGVLIHGIFVPIEFKFGNVKTRFIFMITILLFSMWPAIFANFLGGVDFSKIVDSIASIPIIVTQVTLILLSILFFLVSMAISIKIFSSKEL